MCGLVLRKLDFQKRKVNKIKRIKKLEKMKSSQPDTGEKGRDPLPESRFMVCENR